MIDIYKKVLYYIIMILIVCSTTGCKMIKNEIERSIQKDMKTFLDDNFDTYADAHHEEKAQVYKEKVEWAVKSSGGTVALISGIGGLILLKRKLWPKNE